MKSDSSWVLVLAALPIVMKTVSFPEHTWNVLAWIAVGITNAALALYTFVLFAIAMTHMLPSTRREIHTLGTGMFDPKNFDDAGQDVHRRFRRACALLLLGALFGGVVVIAFPL